eukprot:GEMP01020237.1.p1 GENE.GEMP01020237.1~~GEMP01020237.1.p1  ORF type:complete len:768 (+),score=169.15 GEMP01020237.1:172-2475(+)
MPHDMATITWSGWKLIPLAKEKASFGAAKGTVSAKRPPIHVKTVGRPTSSSRQWRAPIRRLEERQRPNATWYPPRPVTSNSTAPLQRRKSPNRHASPSPDTPLRVEGVAHEAKSFPWAPDRVRSPRLVRASSLQRADGIQQRPCSKQRARRVPFPPGSQDGRPRSEHRSMRLTSEQNPRTHTDVAVQKTHYTEHIAVRQRPLSTQPAQRRSYVIPSAEQWVHQRTRPRSMQSRHNRELFATSYMPTRPSTAGVPASAPTHAPESRRKHSVASRKGIATQNTLPQADLTPCSVAQANSHPWGKNLDDFRDTSNDEPVVIGDAGALHAGARMVPVLHENGEFTMEPMFADHLDSSSKPVKPTESVWQQPEARHEWKPDVIEEEIEQEETTTTSGQPKKRGTVRKSIRASCVHADIGNIIEDEEDKQWKEKARQFFLKLKLYVHKMLEPTYPMYVIHVKDFEKMGSLKSHEDLLTEGDILHDLFQLDKKTSFCTFCVHEWLDHRHPDPYKIHYRTALSYASEKMEAVEQLGSKTQVYVWVDYCCLPTTTSTGQKDIPCYIARSDSLVVVAPFYRHSSGRVCDSKSFYRRGWCTLEIFCKICFSFEEQHQYVTHDGNFPGTALGAQGRSALLQTILEVNPLRRCFGCCEVNHIKELALSEVSKSKDAKAVRELPCDRKKLSYALIAAYAFALYKAIHLHGKWSSEELATMLKQGREELLVSVVPETLAEFTESTGEHLFTAEEYANVIQLAKVGEVSGTRYNTSFELPHTT